MNPQVTYNLKLSAPGKVILFGEYSVVFNKPAIAATLNLRTKLNLVGNQEEIIYLNFTALELDKKFSLRDIQEYIKPELSDAGENYLPLLKKAIENLYSKTYGVYDLKDAQEFSLIAFFHCFLKIFKFCNGFSLKIDTELPVGSGVGSSASFSVVLSSAVLLYSLHCKKDENIEDFIVRNEGGELKISEKFKNQISEMAMSCEKIFHGTPSGVDHNTILQGSMLEFIKSDDNNNKMSQINACPIKILLVNTNVPRSTKTLLGCVRQLKEDHPGVIQNVLNAMESIAKSAIADLTSFKEGSSEVHKLEHHFGELITLNHNLLRVLGTSHPKLEHIVSIANKYSLNAKLTGGGGGGFAFIYLPSNVEAFVIKSIEKDLNLAGCTPYEVSLGGSGLIIEELLH